MYNIIVLMGNSEGGTRPSALLSMLHRVWSKDQERLCKEGGDPIYDGGRALPAVIRPYAHLVAGKPVKMSYVVFERGVREYHFFFSFLLCHSNHKNITRIAH